MSNHDRAKRQRRKALMSTEILVPKAFTDLGYTGLFHTTATFPDHATREAARAMAPYLLGNSGWMVLRVNDAGKAVMVRKDGAAIVDLFTIRPQGKPHG